MTYSVTRSERSVEITFEGGVIATGGEDSQRWLARGVDVVEVGPPDRCRRLPGLDVEYRGATYQLPAGQYTDDPEIVTICRAVFELPKE